MDHTEARAQLLEWALEPARLRGLDQDTSPGSSELRAHLATCAACRADLEGWQATYGALDAAIARRRRGTAIIAARSLRELAASAGVATPPAALRERTLAAVHERTPTPVSRPRRPRRSIRPPAWLAIAAALVVLLGGAAIVVDRTQQLDQSRADTAALAAVTASLDHILQDPGHQVACSQPAAGTPAGSVSWSASDGPVVVLTSALANPPPGTGVPLLDRTGRGAHGGRRDALQRLDGLLGGQPRLVGCHLRPGRPLLGQPGACQRRQQQRFAGAGGDALRRWAATRSRVLHLGSRPAETACRARAYLPVSAPKLCRPHPWRCRCPHPASSPHSSSLPACSSPPALGVAGTPPPPPHPPRRSRLPPVP